MIPRLRDALVMFVIFGWFAYLRAPWIDALEVGVRWREV
jgi:hypothetical protein